MTKSMLMLKMFLLLLLMLMLDQWRQNQKHVL